MVSVILRAHGGPVFYFFGSCPVELLPSLAASWVELFGATTGAGKFLGPGHATGEFSGLFMCFWAPLGVGAPLTFG